MTHRGPNAIKLCILGRGASFIQQRTQDGHEVSLEYCRARRSRRDRYAGHTVSAAIRWIEACAGYTEIDAPEDKKIMAYVLFPKDPKRRLEVWWENEDSRKGTHLIVIGGQSTWTAPKGLKLGLSLAAIEKLNGKPFKVKGFDKENVALITDWQDGALSQLPGGCRP